MGHALVAGGRRIQQMLVARIVRRRAVPVDEIARRVEPLPERAIAAAVASVGPPRDDEGAVRLRRDGGLGLAPAGRRIDPNLAADRRAVRGKELRVDSLAAAVLSVHRRPGDHEVAVAQRGDARILVVAGGAARLAFQHAGCNAVDADRRTVGRIALEFDAVGGVVCPHDDVAAVRE
jgi:hypothetical protein